MKTYKIKKIEKSKNDVFDFSVEDSRHYILSNGVISHNSVGSYFPTNIQSGGSGAIYNASIILEFGKANLKEDDKDSSKKAADMGMNKSGILVTSKVVKNRFAKPIPIKFHISFYKGMNRYVGLENYISWETCGIERGSFKEEIIEELVFNDDGTPKMFRGKQKVQRTATGNFVFEADPKAKAFAVKHLNREIKNIFNGEVFTQEVLEKLDEVIRPIFELPTNTMEGDELEEALGIESDDDVENSHVNAFNQKETQEEIDESIEEAKNTENEA